MDFEGHICCWHVYGYSMVNKLWFVVVCAVMWGLHVDHIIFAVGHTCLMWQAYFLGTYANNVEWKYTSTCGHIVDCSEFIWGIYTDIVVWCLHMS